MHTAQIHCRYTVPPQKTKRNQIHGHRALTQIDAHLNDTDTQSMIYKITNTDTKRHQHKKTQTDQRPKPPFCNSTSNILTNSCCGSFQDFAAAFTSSEAQAPPCWTRTALNVAGCQWHDVAHKGCKKERQWPASAYPGSDDGGLATWNQSYIEQTSLEGTEQQIVSKRAWDCLLSEILSIVCGRVSRALQKTPSKSIREEEKGGLGSSAWPFPVRGGNSGHFGGGVGASHRCARQLEGCGWDLRLGGAGKPCQARCARHKMPKRLLEQKLHLRNNTAINLPGENYHNMKSGSWHVLEFSSPELLCNVSVFSPWMLCAGSSLIWIANSKGSLRSLRGDEGIWGHVSRPERARLIYGAPKSKYSNIRTCRSLPGQDFISPDYVLAFASVHSRSEVKTN